MGLGGGGSEGGDKDLTSWGAPHPPGASSSSRPGQLNAAQTPEGPWAPASRSARPGGHDGCLAGAPLARRLVPGLGLHAAALPELERGPAGPRVGLACSPPHSPCRPPLAPPSPPALPPSAVGGRSRGGGMERTLSSSIGDICSESRGGRGGYRRGRRGGARSSAPATFPATSGLGADGGVGMGRGRSRPVPHITTPMKFPMGRHEAGSPSPAAPPASSPSDLLPVPG